MSTTNHEHQFPETDTAGTRVLYPCLLCGLPALEGLKACIEERAQAQVELARLQPYVQHAWDCATRGPVWEFPRRMYPEIACSCGLIPVPSSTQEK